MKTILRLALLIATLAGLAVSSRAAETSIQGILITASNEPGKTDGRLAQYEPTLRRILRFESYHYIGDDRANLDIPATGMPIVEGCWGWATGFFVVAEQDGLSDDWPVNAVVTSAWIAHDDVITLEGFSLELE